MFLKKFASVFLFCSLFFICSCGNQSNFSKAEAYKKDGEYQKAVEYYILSISHNEKVAESEKNIGDILFGDGFFGQALEHYKNSIEIDPNVALETVMKYISYNDAKVRAYVAQMLSDVENEQAKQQINEKLATILKSGDQYKIIDALEIADRMKNNLEPISDDIFNLLDDNDIIKQKVLKVLPKVARIVPEKYGFEKLINFLNQKDEIIKTNTIECLGNMHEYAISTLPDLIELAVRENRYSKNIFAAIEKMGVPTKEQMKNMNSFLKDKPKEIKINMLNIWGNFGEKANAYVPNIICFLNDEDADVKTATRNALLKIGKASQESVPDLINLLKETNNEIVLRAIYELGEIGKGASDAIEPLKEIVKNTQNREIKTSANEALQKIQ